MLAAVAASHVLCAQNAYVGTAEVTLQFNPANPSMSDAQLEVRAFVNLGTVSTSDGNKANLSGFSIPVGFDTSRVRLVSVSAVQASGFVEAGFSSTDPAVANARGFVTLMNTRTGTEYSGLLVELARMIFQPVRPGTATFLAGSARTIHPGNLIGAPLTAGATAQRIPWTTQSYALEIEPAAAYTSLLCPSWFSVSGIFQGVAFLNEGTQTASLEVSGWDRNGVLVQSAFATNPSPPLLVSPSSQQAKVVEEIFKSREALGVEHGWLEIRSNQPNVSGFFLQGITSATGIEAMDGADMVHVPASRIIFPVLGSDSSRATEIALVNPGGSPVSATIFVRNPDGGAEETIQAVVTAHGAAVREIVRTTGYVEVEAVDGLLMGFERFGTGKALAALNGMNGAVVYNRLAGPQFASGNLGRNLRIDTRITLVNPSAAASEVVLRLLDEEGHEITAPVVRSMPARSQLSSPGWELFGLANPLTTFRLTVGSVSVTSDPGVIGVMTFGDPAGGTYLSASPLMSTSSARRELYFGHVAVGLLGGVDYFTGMALVNMSPAATANIQLRLYDAEGKFVAGTERPYTLGPGSRTAQLVEQLIPGFRGSQFGGYIHLISDSEVCAYMLFGDSSYNFLSAVPVR